MRFIGILVFLALALQSAFAAGSNTLGPPTYQWMCTYSIRYYEGYEPELPRAHGHADRFVSQMSGQFAQWQPSISVYHSDNAKDRDANLPRLISNSTSCEFVNIVAHGGPETFALFPNSTPNTGVDYVIPNDKSYGVWNRFVLGDACQVLKRGNSGITDNGYHGYKYWFGGVHAVFSHRANTYWYYIADCGLFGCDRYRSEYFYDSFAAYYVRWGNHIWDAWHMSYRDRIYNQGGYGGSPAAVYMTFDIGGGTTVAGIQEYATLQWNGDFNAINYSGAPTNRLFRVYVDYGTPNYSPLSPPND